MKLFLKMSDDYLKKSGLIALLFLVVLSGCVTNKHATYLQEYEDSEYSGEFVPLLII